MEHSCFSVVIPLYNKEQSIGSTIESVLNQTYPWFELIIIDDGSTDSSLKKVYSYDDPRIRIVEQTNKGVSAARNIGIDSSKNEFIVFLDADDLWLPFCLEEFSKLILDFPEADVFCTNFNISGKSLKGSDRRYYVENYYFTSSYYLAKWSITMIITGCIAIRKFLFSEVGYFNPKLTHGEDIDMWERLAVKYKFAKSDMITTIYRTDAENRASLLDERLKKGKKWIQFKKDNSITKSQKLLYGIQLLYYLRSNPLSGWIFNMVVFIKFLDWIMYGIVFIFKVRILNKSIF
jgi:glycosyltransferase involved in cell wall biosynthesis